MQKKTRPIKMSFSLPPKLLREVEGAAKKESRTKSELIREALRRYLAEQRLRELQRYGARQAKKLGINTEDDIQRVIEQYRREHRQNT